MSLGAWPWSAGMRITSDIIKRHSSNIAVEDLKLQSMTTKGGSRKRGLNRSMQEQCLGMLIQQHAYKAESAGGKLAKIKPHYTTQQCSSCGGMSAAPIGLGVRSYQCDQCGLVLERDINAARKIRQRGPRLWSMLKRGYHGTYHQMSSKHLGRYVKEFSGRHNQRPFDTVEQMQRVATGMDGRSSDTQTLSARGIRCSINHNKTTYHFETGTETGEAQAWAARHQEVA